MLSLNAAISFFFPTQTQVDKYEPTSKYELVYIWP